MHPAESDYIVHGQLLLCSFMCYKSVQAQDADTAVFASSGVVSSALRCRHEWSDLPVVLLQQYQVSSINSIQPNLLVWSGHECSFHPSGCLPALLTQHKCWRTLKDTLRDLLSVLVDKISFQLLLSL